MHLYNLQSAPHKSTGSLTIKNSNGIRFSITDASTPLLPTLYQSRAGISLYDAQYPVHGGPRQPIPEPTIQDVLDRLLHFKTTCQEDFNVPSGNIHILATEATRTAVNSETFRERIKEETGWVVKMLEKEEEGRVGGMGVVASFGGGTKGGLVMDLGGGSTQITWVSVGKDGKVMMSPRGSFSFPYGAAALKARLEQVDGKGTTEEKKKLKDEMVRNFQRAYRDLEVPELLRREGGGLDLYLSGGGFRGWGYLLMERASVNPYPIPIINGFRVRKEEFHDTASVLETVSDATTEVKIFGVSKRRASQVPAVAFLVNVLVDALPDIQNIQFCQGGVREGFLYDRLPPESRLEDILVAATRPYAMPSADIIQSLLSDALPSSGTYTPPPSFSHRLLSAFANLFYIHSSVPKETRSAAALHSTTSGILASTNSLTHLNRSLLALALCERWNGDLAPTDQSLHNRLRQCVSAAEAWWCQYLGRVGALIGDIYPSGVVPSGKQRVQLEVQGEKSAVATKKNDKERLLRLVVKRNPEGMRDVDGLKEHAKRIEKTGKKKNWLVGYGSKVSVSIVAV